MKEFLTLMFTFTLSMSFSQQPLENRLSITTGSTFINNDFYTVNTVADMHFDVGLGWRFDVQYEHEVYTNIFVFGGLGLAWHRQHIDINQHHRDPSIPFEDERYDQERHNRTYGSAFGGLMLKIDESKNKKLKVYAPLGMYNLFGLSRSYSNPESNVPGNLNFESWFWGLYTGLILDYELAKNVHLRLAPTYTHFFTQYPHYTGTQNSVDVSVGVVFGF